MTRLRFVLFLVRVQWIDRRATSSFLMGITIQTALLSLALYRAAETSGEALTMATRAAMLTCTAIVLLAAMSNVQNEFRYGTIERALLGKVPFSRLIGIRSAASAVVASPAVVVPFVAAVARFPDLAAPRSAVLVAMVYVTLGTLCYQSTLVLCQFRDAAFAVPWLRMALLFLGLSVIPFPGSDTVALFFPTGWMLLFAEGGDAGELAGEFAVFTGVVAGWTAAVWCVLRKRSLRVVERNLTSGAEAT